MDLFEQFPACNYTTNYGFAMAEQMNLVAPAYNVEYNGFYPGDDPPVTINKVKKRVVIETEEMVYDKKSFAIFITATPEITKFQDPITGVAAPFTVSFVTNESLAVNFAPTIKSYTSSFYIDPLKQSKINVG